MRWAGGLEHENISARVVAHTFRNFLLLSEQVFLGTWEVSFRGTSCIRIFQRLGAGPLRRAGRLYHRRFLFPPFRRLEPALQAWAAVVPSEASVPASQMATFSPCPCVCVHISAFCKDSSRPGLGRP